MAECIRIAYLAPWTEGFLSQAVPGVFNKIAGQVKALNGGACTCELKTSSLPRSTLTKIKMRLPFLSDQIDWDSLANPADYDCFYVRKPDFISKDFISFAVKAKKKNPDIQILLEIPTYPYDDEEKTLVAYPKLIKDRLHRNKLAGCIDRIVDLSRHEEIFGVPTIPLINGIDLAGIQPRQPSISNNSGIHIICTAFFSEWHGLDRFIAGMESNRELVLERNINLHLLGDGPVLPALKQQVAKAGLLDHVTFYGQCNRSQMDEIYNKCALAIECLGIHRKGLALSSSLKSREYLAKGIPFLYSGEIDVFQENPVDFCLQVPANEVPVDMDAFVRFYDELYTRESEEDIIRLIRHYAECHVGIDKAMAEVIKYLEESFVNEK